MKYLLPDVLLLSIGIFFTKSYIDVCIYFFNFFYQITTLRIFNKLFLAFPFVTLLIFILIGCIKKFLNRSIEYENQNTKIKVFFRKNIIFVMILIAFFIRVLEAFYEPAFISPYWVIQYGAFNLLLNMIGLFCISSAMLHLFFSIKNVLKNKGN